MDTTIYIPVQKLIDDCTEERNITGSEYDRMLYDDFRRYDPTAQRYADRLAGGGYHGQYDPYGYGFSPMGGMTVSDAYGNKSGNLNDDDMFEWRKAEAEVTGYTGKELQAEDLDLQSERGGMFIMMVDVRPLTMDDDTVSEMRFWISDSEGVESDPTLDNEAKIRALPSRDLKVSAGRSGYRFRNCKILQTYGTDEKPFRFAMIAQKIIKIS